MQSRSLQKAGNPAKWGDDFGGDEETIISKDFDKPVIIHRYPVGDEGVLHGHRRRSGPTFRLSFDMIAPEGYGEIIGGGERLADYDTLVKRLREHNLPEEAFPVVSRPAPLRQRPARGLRPGPGTHGGLDLRNGAHPRSDSLPAHALSRLSLVSLGPWPRGGTEQSSKYGQKNTNHRRADGLGRRAAAVWTWARRRCAWPGCRRG